MSFWVFGLALLAGGPTLGMVRPDPSIFLMPLTCGELLPDNSPFVNYFEAVARGAVSKDRGFSKRLFRVLALREKLAEAADRAREANPVDVLIRKTLCFYREQKEPMRPVAYDDAAFTRFLKDSIKSLEAKVDDAVFQWEFERQQRKEYERQLQRNQSLVDGLQKEAEADAARSYERLSNAARRKVEAQ